jgi:hypothetical protein
MLAFAIDPTAVLMEKSLRLLELLEEPQRPPLVVKENSATEAYERFSNEWQNRRANRRSPENPSLTPRRCPQCGRIPGPTEPATYNSDGTPTGHQNCIRPMAR